MPEELPILIVGAGPTGMTAAMELSRMGVPVKIIDKAHAPSDTSRALAVQARTLELFSQRGLSDAMLAAGNRGNATTIYSDGRVLGRVDLSQIESSFNFCLLIPQSETERILREQLQRQFVPVEFGTELVAFSQSGQHPQKEGVRAVLRKEDGSLQELEAAYVISAEGAHSLVRNTLGLLFKGKSLPHSYALADLHIDGEVPEDELSIFLPSKGLMAVFPMGKRRYRMIATEPEDTGDPSGGPSLEHMQDLWNQDSHIPANLRDMYWSSQFRINSRLLDRIRHGRIFFGGDSAHIHSPAGGQGMNTGIQDMINLGWKLALVYKGQASEALLDTYEEERLPIIKDLVDTTESATDAFTADNSFFHKLLKLAAPVALQIGAVQKRGAKILSQTATSYAGSSLTKGSSRVGSVQAGERVPPPHRSTETPRKHIDPNRLTLFTTKSQEADIAGMCAPWLDVIDIRTDMAAVFGDEQGADMVLVRPDEHIALITRNREDIAIWCQQWLQHA